MICSFLVIQYWGRDTAIHLEGHVMIQDCLNIESKYDFDS